MPPPPPAPKCDKDVIDMAVMRELIHNQHVNGSYFDSVEFLRSKNTRIVAIREWASQLSEKTVRSKYNSWLNHFERENNDYIKRILNPAPKKTGPTDYEVMTEKIRECEEMSPLPRFPR